MVTSNKVLIVGAGPTGLVLGSELARRGIRFRLIDKKDGPSNTSRSFTIHARTMEMFEHMGIAGHFLKDGIRNQGFFFNFKGQEAKPTLDFSGLDSPFPFILVYSQNETERHLLDHLKTDHDITPEWSTALTKLEPAGDGKHKVTLRHSDANLDEVIIPEWIIGCDGVHSRVRDAAGLEFPGGGYDGMVMQMMDATFTGFDGSDDRIHYYMSKDSFLLVSKLPGDCHRILVSMMGGGLDSELSQRDTFQKVIEKHIENTKVGEPKWATKWEIWKRLAADYTKDNIILVGDAAHVHSPSGGQGMNCGMQDAFNLGWKLAMTIQGHAKPELLNTYEPERKPIGAQIIAGTDAMHNIIMAHGKGMKDRLELTQTPGWHDEAVNRISGLSYHYRGSVSTESENNLRNGLSVGDRAPDVDLSDGGRLFDLTRHANFTMVLAALKHTDNPEIENIRSTIDAQFGELVEIIVLGIEGANLAFADRYGTDGDGQAFLIRPDGYLAGIVALRDCNKLIDVLKGWLNIHSGASDLLSAAG